MAYTDANVVRSLERNNEKRKVFWALERKQWTMQRKRNARKERRKKRNA